MAWELAFTISFNSNKNTTPASPSPKEKTVAFPSILTLSLTPQQKANYKNISNSSVFLIFFLRALVWGHAIQILNYEYHMSHWRWKTILGSNESWYVAYFPIWYVFKEPKVKCDIAFYLKSEQFSGCCIKIQSTVCTEMCLFYSKIKAFLF